MAFKLSKLIIRVLPDVGEKPLAPLAHAQAQNCAIVILGGSVTTIRDLTFTWSPFYPTLLASDPETLAILKGQLQEALAHVQAHEQAINVKMSPQTVEEAQALEDHLTAALEEVQRQKAALRDKATEG